MPVVLFNHLTGIRIIVKDNSIAGTVFIPDGTGTDLIALKGREDG